MRRRRVPMRRFDRTSWPEHGPHRDLLDLLDDVHVHHGCPSERVLARRLRTSTARVRDVVRGRALPGDAVGVRDLVAALAAQGLADPATADRAEALTVAARRERDGAGPWPAGRRTGRPLWSPPGVAPAAGPATTGTRRTAVAALLLVLTAAVATAVVLSGHLPL
ncbi:hypothetical protein ACIGG9_18620 [Pseudonocardia alni]|uniref:hypothetical protein n=1 Tax=Pseudonocardia alni TaxID=33907 RepID=UPI0033E7E583